MSLSGAQQMDQVDSESRVVTADSSAKKLARQLDFTPMCKVPANVVLPDHPQAKLQLKIEAKLKPKPQSQPQPVLQPKPHVQIIRPITRPELQTRAHLAPVVQRALSHPVPFQPLPGVQFESPETKCTVKVEAKDITPKKRKQCNCKNSKCLKLYCECFAAGVYCDGCNCADCHNNVEHETFRQEAVTAALDRNPNAFRPKIANSPNMPRNGRVESGDSAIAAKHNKGCHCKKSGCLKKYCECFQGNIPCSENCRCVDCKNCEGSEERKSLCYGDNLTPTIKYQHQAANAIIKETLGPYGYKISHVSRKRKSTEQTVMHFQPTQQNTQCQRRSEYAEMQKQDNGLKPSALSSPAIVMTLASSKITFSSLMAGIIQPQFITKLCSEMVVASAEVVKEHTENIGTTENQLGVADTDRKDVIITQPSNANARDGNDETTTRTDNSISIQADGECSSDVGSTSGELQNERPMSPGMLALMCDENDTSFTLESEKRVQGLDKASGFNSDLHAKQEKVILTRFRDFLNHLVVCASVKESMHNNEVQNQQLRALNGNNSIHRPQLLVSNLNCSNSTVRPQFPTINHSSSNSVIRPRLPTSNHHVSNIIVMSDAPKTNHITDHSIVRTQLHVLDDQQQPSTK